MSTILKSTEKVTTNETVVVLSYGTVVEPQHVSYPVPGGFGVTVVSSAEGQWEWARDGDADEILTHAGYFHPQSPGFVCWDEEAVYKAWLPHHMQEEQ